MNLNSEYKDHLIWIKFTYTTRFGILPNYHIPIEDELALHEAFQQARSMQEISKKTLTHKNNPIEIQAQLYILGSSDQILRQKSSFEKRKNDYNFFNKTA